jgi:two-component system chemotaxis response regulator CheB
LYRQSIQNVLRQSPNVTIVGTARNGLEALEKIEALDPDLLTLDLQMPDMDGLQVLMEINRRRLRVKAIMVSSFTSEGAQATTDALLEGAFDFILKPTGNDSATNRQLLKDALEEKVAAFRESTQQRGNHTRIVDKFRVATEAVFEPAPIPSFACRAVIIGASTGGPQALKTVLPRLPAELSVPVLVVQHMPAKYTCSLAKRLHELCALDVREASDGMEAIAGRVLIAPGGKQMKLERDGQRMLVRVNDDPSENGVRPAVDYLIRSASELYLGNVLVVIMTGMGRDGLLGCQNLKKAGGYVFAQSQEDCVVYGMPKAVIDEGLADRVLTMGKIAPAIVRHLKRGAGQ